jgi:hypothetical protein
VSEGRKWERITLREMLEEIMEDDGLSLDTREGMKTEVKKLQNLELGEDNDEVPHQ